MTKTEMGLVLGLFVALWLGLEMGCRIGSRTQYVIDREHVIRMIDGILAAQKNTRGNCYE